MLAMVDWTHVHLLASKSSQDQYRWVLDLLLPSKRFPSEPGDGPFPIGVMLILAGVYLCLEFKGDPPPRKDPWEK